MDAFIITTRILVPSLFAREHLIQLLPHGFQTLSSYSRYRYFALMTRAKFDLPKKP